MAQSAPLGIQVNLVVAEAAYEVAMKCSHIFPFVLLRVYTGGLTF
jgi:hypothetical protein